MWNSADKYGYPALIFSLLLHTRSQICQKDEGTGLSSLLAGSNTPTTTTCFFPKSRGIRVARTIAEAPHESGGTRTRQLDPRVRLSIVVVSERAPPNRPEPRFGPEARVLVAGDGPFGLHLAAF
jgi:hypothetical protein